MNESRIALFSIALSAGLGLSNSSPAQTFPPGPIRTPAAEPITPLTTQERIAKLEEDLVRLQAELQFIQAVEAQGGLTSAIVAQIRQRAQTPRSVGVGIGRNALLRPKRPHIFTAGERKTLSASVVMTVNGIPVIEQRVEAMVTYLRTYLPDATEEDLMGKTILALAAGES